MNNQPQPVYYDEDEIDLRELFKTIVKYKKFIIVFTLIITMIAALYAFFKKPIYEVKSNVEIGFIGKDKKGKKALLDDADVIVKKLRIIFHVDEKLQGNKKFVAEVSDIVKYKKIDNIIKIETEGISKNVALKENEKVVTYLQKNYAPKINQYILNTTNQVKDLKLKIKNINDFETKEIQRQISILKTQDIAKINEKIKFYKDFKIPTLRKKINFYTINLTKYTKEVQKLYSSNKKNKNSTIATIASLQMVNYQNLILNAQNKIEDLNIGIQKINNEDIPNLEREKENILNDNIKKLQHKLTFELPNKKLKLQERIEQLKFNISNQNIQNSQVMGNYIVYDYPVKPKKKLIIIVAFVSGLILSIFLVFFIEFIKSMKE